MNILILRIMTLNDNILIILQYPNLTKLKHSLKATELLLYQTHCVFKKIINNRLFRYLENNGYPNSNQAGWI